MTVIVKVDERHKPGCPMAKAFLVALTRPGRWEGYYLGRITSLREDEHTFWMIDEDGNAELLTGEFIGQIRDFAALTTLDNKV